MLQNQYINTAKESIEELEQIIRSENGNADLHRDAGWDEESIIADVSKEQFSTFH